MTAQAARRRLGVVGWPVAHSRSPAMHNAALAHVGLTAWRYQLLPIPPTVIEQTLCALPDAGFAGVNVTIPHKQAALAAATEHTERAAAIGAANTLVYREDGAIVADNTDAPALTETLAVLPSPVASPRSALVLGAGGSARAALWALRDAGVADLAIWNRTAERAAALAAEFDALALTEAEAARPVELLVNCTAVELHGADPFAELPVTAAQLARCGALADYAYGPGETRLVAVARRAGVPVVDGLELLVAQGALAFERFTGRAAPRAVMRAAARP
ncbi:MAG TPA: shikimate dehydrogenase [Solirubrobacteraceae bacterium]|nr:shikimate dehydrogenase [Solirubrobacteraceae bacterium]